MPTAFFLHYAALLGGAWLAGLALAEALPRCSFAGWPSGVLNEKTRLSYGS